METIEEQKQAKVPVVRIDETMQDYDGRVYFPEKIEKANEMLRTIGLPKTEEKPKE
jgi:hypothetical protein